MKVLASGAYPVPPIAEIIDDLARVSTTLPKNGWPRGTELSRLKLLAQKAETVTFQLSEADLQALSVVRASVDFADQVNLIGNQATYELYRVASGTLAEFEIYLVRAYSTDSKVRATKFLKEYTKSLARGVACGLAWDQLTGTQQADANRLDQQQGFTGIFSTFMHLVYSKTEAELVQRSRETGRSLRKVATA